MGSKTRKRNYKKNVSVNPENESTDQDLGDKGMEDGDNPKQDS